MVAESVVVNASCEAVLGEEVCEFGSVDQGEGFAFGELSGAWSEAGGGDQDSFDGSLVQDGAVQVADDGGWDGGVVAFDLDDDASAADRVGVGGYHVDAAVSGPFGGLCLQAHDLEQVGD